MKLARNISRLLVVFIGLSFVSCASETRTAPETADQFTPPKAGNATDPNAQGNRCLDCHDGIEMISGSDSAMMAAIFEMADESGTGNRCVVCHGGNPRVSWSGDHEPEAPEYQTAMDQAHSGSPAWLVENEGPQQFYPDPGSPWINRYTCGMCHDWQVQAQWRSLMMTEAGKIQGTAWGFGGLEGYQHRWANYDVENPKNPDEVMGTATFRAYLDQLASKEPQVFVDAMVQLPPAPTAEEVDENPAKSAFTYIRGECQRCHLGVRGKQRYGDYRGMGCSACHMPYGNAGVYQGQDKTLMDNRRGRPLVHSFQSGRNSPVTVGQVTYSGIPVETCTTCHNRGRRIGVSFQGLMESAYASPWMADGKPQQKLHGKNYMKLQEDLHKSHGFLCQDCHTSLDAHSPNRLVGSIAGAVEVECTDCHGTPTHFPWELPLGWGDEYAPMPQQGEPRGLTQKIPAYMKAGFYPEPADGYLLSARGNPLGNAVKQGNNVLVYLASGRTRELTPLKEMVAQNRLNLEARVGMVQVRSHMDKMECYACHATWAPQCYGCHIKVDYQKPDVHVDWVALGQAHNSNGMTGEGRPQEDSLRIPGEITESRSFLRFEDPSLAINGEGRVAPVIPGCQTSVTVLGKDGKPLLTNHIFKIPGVEGAGEEGQLGIDHSPLHPHTVQKKARGCGSCHASDKALGYGISGGRVTDDPDRDHVVDLTTGEGQIIPTGTTPQMTAMNGLIADWSRFVDESGRQLQTVGHHFELSRPLNNDERGRMNRQGVCLACHQEIPDRSLAVSLLHHIADTIGMLPATDAEHSDLLVKNLLLGGWVQLLTPVFLIMTGVVFVLFWRRKRLRAKKKDGPA